ncbi:MAG: FAD:protein FMN transferase [Sedimenticolaceae bacterium]
MSSPWINALRTGPCWLVLTTLLVGCGESPPPVAELSGQTMGTSYSIKLSPAPGEDQRTLLQEKVESRLEAINAQMSTYRSDSDLMRFNQARSTDWLAVPESLVELVRRAAAISRLSEGRYDITVGPLVNLWGFGSAGPRDSPPAATDIARALARTGYQHLEVRESPPALRKTIPDLQLDLSSIAKGWAVDELAGLLQNQGYADFLIEIGGEVRAQGTKVSGQPWRIAVERPLPDQRTVQGTIEVRDFAVATSGDYRNFFEDAGRRYSHTIDPLSGQAVQHRLAAVTVVADDCTDADAWATALMALGDQRGPALADALGLKALFNIHGKRGWRTEISRALQTAAVWRDVGRQ